MRGTRQAVGSEFLGSLESFLVYLESLMEYCKLFLADTAAEAAMKASFCSHHYRCLLSLLSPLTKPHDDHMHHIRASICKGGTAQKR